MMNGENSSSFYNRLPKFADFTNLDTYNWALNDGWEGIVKTFLVVLCSFAIFRLLQYTVRFYLFGKCSFRTFDYFKFGRGKRRRNLPSSTELEIIPPNKKWRISNEAVSLIHSVISGLLALYSITTYPDLLNQMNTFTHPVPKFLVYISFGYILHDLLDLLINERSVRILELLFHHVIVVAAFLTTLVTNLFLGVVVLGLLMEINSIFLHSRSLLNLYRQPKDSTAFKFVALLNILTFALFRIAVSVYLLYWQFSNMFSTLYWYHSIVTFIVIVSLSITNSVLLYRVLSADGLLGLFEDFGSFKLHLGQDRARRPTINNTEQIADFTEMEDDDDVSGGSDEENSQVATKTATQTTDSETLSTQPVQVVVHT